MAENNDLQHKLVNDVYAELGTISRHSQDAIDYLMRHGWIRTPEEAEAVARGQRPGQTMTNSEFREAVDRVLMKLDGITDTATACASFVIESGLITVVADPPEPTNVEPGTRDWWVEKANTADAEDCEACEGDLCPVHYGISMGINLMAKKIAALGDDPELFALIPEPAKAPGVDDD